MMELLIGGNPRPSPVFSLDVADINSVATSSTLTWANLIASPADGSSQATYNFTRSASNQPRFNGTPGNLTFNESWEWFDSPSSGYFTIGSNTNFINSIHKANAAFTIVAFIRPHTPVDSTVSIMGTNGNSNSIGFQLFIDTGTGTLKVTNGSGTVLNKGVANISGSVFYMVAFSVDASQGVNGGLAYVNGNTTSFDATYTSPSASSAAYPLDIAAMGNGQSIIPGHSGTNDTYLFRTLLYNRALTKFQLDKVYYEYKSRYGL